MRVDMFFRAEQQGRVSYLAVPQGRPIPEEATNTDWEIASQGIELAVTDAQLTGLDAGDAERQIDDKGYAISSIRHPGKPWPVDGESGS